MARILLLVRWPILIGDNDNGAGETTSKDMATGKARPEEGTITFHQTTDLTRLDEAETAELGKDIGLAIRYPRDQGAMAILLVEQYFEFARELADRFAVMDRGRVVSAGVAGAMDDAEIRRHLTV